MLAYNYKVKQHSFKGPNPLSSTKNRRYASLTGLFKSDSSTSLHDIAITAPKPRRAREKPKSRETTVIPLLGRDGSQAALVPEKAKSVGVKPKEQPDPGTTEKGGETKTLRFPLLSPTRQETVLFLRMKAMEKATRLATTNLGEQFDYSRSPERDTFRESPGINFPNPPTRGHTRGRASVELSKVPPSRERQLHMEKMGFPDPSNQINEAYAKSGRRGKKKPKIIVASKHGYSSRSNSSTYRRLNRARNKMDDLLETQVVNIMSRSELPSVAPTPEVREEIIDSNQGISVSRDRSRLGFNLDRSIYETFRESKDLAVLYRKDLKSRKSNKSSRSSSRSLTIVLPKVEREPTAISSLPTDRTDRARPTTPYDQYIHDPANPSDVNLVLNGTENESGNVTGRPNTTEKVPLSLQEVIENSEFQRNPSRNGTVLPDIRRAITFDAAQTAHPGSPKKRSRKGRKPRPKTNDGESNPVAFLLDDSKSLTPSPSKTKRGYKPRQTSLSTISNSDTTALNTHQHSPNDTEKEPKENTNHESENQEAHGQTNLKPKQSSRSSSKFSDRKLYSATPPIPLAEQIKKQTEKREFSSSPVLHDSDDEYMDDFENI